ncbi:MAG: CoA pyrophosphatase [Alphaproteobacteria bacterium]
MALVQDKEVEAFSLADLRRRAQGVLADPRERIEPGHDPLTGRSDFDLNPELAKLEGADRRRPAAVLVPIIERDCEARVLFTQRAEHLSSHAGQISFPGGKMDPRDANVAETALREAQEEIGLDPRYVDTIGFLDDYATSTGYRISPLVAVIREGYSIVPDDNEVAEIFDVPLSFLMDSSNHKLHTRQWRGVRRQFYAMSYEERFIWGATAGMLRNLYEALYRTGGDI